MIDFSKIATHLLATQSLIAGGNLVAAKHAFSTFVSMYKDVEQLALNFVDEAQDHQITKLQICVLQDQANQLENALSDLERSRESAKKLRDELTAFTERFENVEAIDKSWEKTISSYEKNKNESTEIINELASQNRSLRQEIRELKEQKSLDSGVVIGSMLGKGKAKNRLKYELKFYWEELKYESLTFDGTRLIAGLPFHFKLSGSNGISVDVQLTETGTGLMPSCEELEKDYPGKPMNDLIHQQFLKLKKYIDPNILLYIQDLKKTPATTLKFVKPDMKKALQKAKKITLFDVLSTTKRTFIKDMNEAKTKMHEDDLTIIYVSLYAYATKIREQYLESDYKDVSYQIKAK
ncbi:MULTISPECIES: hypothetical protein [Vibrio]|uniref:hypothetical protein n=1 Tax=Vibrio TaxID=662 RepID=UPI00078C0999|nr:MULTISPECIES: hypothetical protein [Vibrio]BAU70782.1 hypothetical protein [Vibrio sp. 04Ya108]BBM67650.1 hypothetical protein VA249_42960 [Vibrio alfacsensis]BCN27132.1 hypothetical protein VYA_43240 [Vibrio alfacsensis]